MKGNQTGARSRIGALSRSALTPVLAVLFALIASILVILLMGLNPIRAYAALVQGSVGSFNAVGETIIKMTPLIFTGLSFALADKCGLCNIGAEGQLFMGALASSVAGIYLVGLPAPIHVPICILAGFVGGGLWGALAGALKVKFGASEVITTIMLNYVAQYFVNYMVRIPMVEPPGAYPQTPPIQGSAVLIRLIPGTRINLGIVLAVVCIALYAFFLYKTTKGYELRIVGYNAEAARYAGMRPNRSALLAMFLAGGLAGLAGAAEILGVQGRLFQNFSAGYGFDGIAVALLGQGSPLGIFFSAVLFGMLKAGSNMMQMLARVPVSLVGIIQALVILFVVGAGLFDVYKKRRAIRQAAQAAEGGS